MSQMTLRGNRGYALLTGAACSICMLGMLGLAVDLGRMYIARNEAQAYVDSAAMAAALKLDGTAAGLTAARTAVTNNVNRWHMGNRGFVNPITEFSTAAAGPWEANPAPAGVLFVRVRAAATPPLYFVPIVGQPSEGRVVARAIAGQVPKTTPYREGSFPFSPIAHEADDEVHFGLVPNRWYTLRWGSNPRLNRNVCPGDNDPGIIDRANSTGSERGYIEDTSSSAIRQSIEGDRMSRPLTVNDTVNMTGGTKQTQQDSIVNRIRQDTDTTATRFADYHGNGRRIVLVPINTWHPEYRVVGFRAFFLLEPSEYLSANGGNQPFCAEYVPNYLQGSDHGGAGGAGAFVVRLVE